MGPGREPVFSRERFQESPAATTTTTAGLAQEETEEEKQQPSSPAEESEQQVPWPWPTGSSAGSKERSQESPAFGQNVWNKVSMKTNAGLLKPGLGSSSMENGREGEGSSLWPELWVEPSQCQWPWVELQQLIITGSWRACLPCPAGGLMRAGPAHNP